MSEHYIVTREIAEEKIEQYKGMIREHEQTIWEATALKLGYEARLADIIRKEAEELPTADPDAK